LLLSILVLDDDDDKIAFIGILTVCVSVVRPLD
jgi:hypothetical protein